MKSIVSICVAAIALFGASYAAAQDAVLDDARLGSVRAALAADVEAARREGFPDEWLLDKIAEGLSKRIAPPRIASAVHALLERIRTADRLLGAVPRERRPLRAAVDALTAGAPETELARLVSSVLARDPGALRAALVTVAELAERDFSGSAAVGATLDAYRRGGQSAVRTLLADARRIDPSAPRDEALRRLGRGIDRGGRGRDHDLDDHAGRGRR